MSNDSVVQALIAAFSLSAAILAFDADERARRLAPFVGLAGQPVWLYFAWKASAVGVGITAAAFTIVYLNAAVRSVQAWRRAS